MRRIIEALVQFRNPILYFVLLGLSLLFLNGRSHFHQYYLEKYSLYFSQSFYNISSDIVNYFRLKKINVKLLKENKILKDFQLKSNSISLYPNAIKAKRRFSFKVIDANVIKNSYLNQRNILIIDKGHEDGITSEMGVISDQGIIGVVKSVSKNYSSVISILNQDLKINVRLKNSSAFGSLSWKGTDTNDFQIDDVVISSSVIKEDTIITGGMSSFFPLGIPLGKISNYEANIKSGYYKINASLFEDPSQVYYVYVVENFDIEEIKKLKKDILK